jgi:hypothetical protein
MKKLIITENQLDALKTLIYEANNKINDDAKFKSFFTELKQSFLKDIFEPNNMGDYITFIFAKVINNEKGTFTWDKDSVFSVVFKLKGSEGANDKSVIKDIINLELVTTDGKSPIAFKFKKGDIFKVYSKGMNGIFFQNGIPYIGFNYENGTVKIPNFVAFQITDSTEKTNAREVAGKTFNKWLEQNQKFIESMNYSPQMFGMDNFFFYPGGQIPIRQLLSHFGFSEHDLELHGISIIIKDSDIDCGVEGFTLKKGGKYNGYVGGNGDFFSIYPKNENSDRKVEYKFYTGGQEMANGARFSLKVTCRIDNGPESETPNGTYRIEVANSRLRI